MRHVKILYLLPGPADYSPEKVTITTPAFTIVGRKPLHLVNGDSPSPGTYSPEKVTLQNTSPAYTFGIKHSSNVCQEGFESKI